MHARGANNAGASTVEIGSVGGEFDFSERENGESSDEDELGKQKKLVEINSEARFAIASNSALGAYNNEMSEGGLFPTSAYSDLSNHLCELPEYMLDS